LIVLIKTNFPPLKVRRNKCSQRKPGCGVGMDE